MKTTAHSGALQRLTSIVSIATCFALPTGAVLAQNPSDLEITTAIEQEFLLDEAVPFNRIDVVTEDGIVTLSGRVSNLAARMHAEEVTGIVKGVRSIVNGIEVVSMARPPAEIERAISDALTADPTTDSYEIEVRAMEAGTVELSGTVESWAERSLAETVAMTVPGVSQIYNLLDVDESRAVRNEAEIHADITGRMRWDVRVDDSLIDVLVRDGGRVILSGTVGSLAEKHHAERLAWVEGVSSVGADNLDVERWARDDDLRRGKYDVGTDEEIETALRRALRYDPRVRDANIEVNVEGGTALIRGTVDNLHARRAAERDATNTVGVERIFNHLKVRPEMLSDAEIAEFVTDALAGYGLLDDNEVDVNVSDHVVRLIGDVDTIVEYNQADRAASAVRGIEDLHNDLTVRGEIPMEPSHWHGRYPRTLRPAMIGHAKSDRVIYEDVRSELFWSPFVDEDDVTIAVEDGLVTLSGIVGSRRELVAARENAFEGGARIVHNDLEVR